jgi:glycosyltransferase involved in cell wall biosynthesis
MALLEAFSMLPREPHRVLVLPGYATTHEDELRSRADDLGIGQATRFVGWVSPDELEALYNAAACFVFPSLYEGFGLPVLEAMARGVPVACSVRASLSEVAGDAAVSFDPEHPSEIARAMVHILDDPAEAARLRAAGRARAAIFTWAATARGTLNTYEQVLSSSSGR